MQHARLIVLIASLAFLVGCAPSFAPIVPPYGISFYFDHSPGASGKRRPFARDEPLIARCYAYKFDRRASPPEAPFARMRCAWRPSPEGARAHAGRAGSHLHPFVFVVRDPDGLVYRWYRWLTENQREAERARWRTKQRGIHWSLDLRAWEPPEFPWQPGRYEVQAITFSSSVRSPWPFETSRAWFDMLAPSDPARRPKPILQAILESDKQQYGVGEPITLRGYLKNIGRRPFLIQTRFPFLEARLVDKRTADRFPSQPPVVRPRLSHFTRLGPGQQIRLFEETFVAGHWDPHWGMGLRSEAFPTPFGGPDRSIVLRLKSPGLFPDDLLPRTGVWSGEAESNAVEIRVLRAPRDGTP